MLGQLQHIAGQVDGHAHRHDETSRTAFLVGHHHLDGLPIDVDTDLKRTKLLLQRGHRVRSFLLGGFKGHLRLMHTVKWCGHVNPSSSVVCQIPSSSPSTASKSSARTRLMPSVSMRCRYGRASSMWSWPR